MIFQISASCEVRCTALLLVTVGVSFSSKEGLQDLSICNGVFSLLIFLRGNFLLFIKFSSFQLILPVI